MKENASKYSVDLMNSDEQFDYDNYALADTIDKSVEIAGMLNSKIKLNDAFKLQTRITLGKELANLKRLNHIKHCDYCDESMDVYSVLKCKS
jgi:hypothetical protein